MAIQRQQSKLNILLAVDGSEHSLAATRFLSDLPLTSASRISVITVLVPRDASSHSAMETVLEQAKVILEARGIAVSAEMLVGYPVDALTQYADQQRPDLIVLGAKGLRATLGILLGGVSQQVLEYGEFPVLIVRAPYSGLEKVLFVTDGSAYSQYALGFLAGFPLPDSTKVHVMHVLPPVPSPSLISRSWPIGSEVIPVPSSYEMDRITTQQAEEDEKAGKALLERNIEILRKGGIEANAVLLRGDAATEVIGYVKENKVNLIVAGARGLSRLRGLLLGSFSRKLVHYADCSVLIVKSRPT